MLSSATKKFWTNMLYFLFICVLKKPNNASSNQKGRSPIQPMY